MNNVYGSISVPGSTPTVINGVTVPNRAPYSLKGILIWTDVDLDVEIRLNVDVIGGGCVTGAQPFLPIIFYDSPFGLCPGDVVTVTATHTDGTAHTVKSTLLVEQL